MRIFSKHLISDDQFFWSLHIFFHLSIAQRKTMKQKRPVKTNQYSKTNTPEDNQINSSSECSREGMISTFQEIKMISEKPERMIWVVNNPAKLNKKYVRFTYLCNRYSSSSQAKIQNELKKYKHLKYKELASLKAYNISDKVELISAFHSQNLQHNIEKRWYLQKYNQWMKALAKGVSQLHQQGIIHNKLQLSNVFVSKGEIKIGLPYFRSIKCCVKKSQDQNAEHVKNNISCAPEILEGYEVSKYNDIWCLGLIFLQLKLQKNIDQDIDFKELEELIKQVKDKPSRFLISDMLTQDPKKRITIDNVINMLNSQIIPENSLFQSKILKLPLLSFMSQETNQQYIQNINLGSKMTLKTIDQHLEVTRILAKSQASKHSTFRPTVGLLIKYTLDKEKPDLFSRTIALDSTTFPLNMEQQGLDITRVVCLIWQNKMKLVINDSGELIGQVDELDTISRDRPEVMMTTNRCMLSVTNQNDQSFDGFLFGARLALTTAHSKTDNGDNIFQVLRKMNNKYAPEQIEATIINESDKQPEKQYVILQLSEQVIRRRYLTLVSNYTQKQAEQKMKEIQYDLIMHYQAGDRAAFHPEMIRFEKNNRFIMKRNVSSDIKGGCPLIVAFSNNHCYAIGMFESETQGFLFDQQFYWHIWESVAQQINNDPLQVTTRMLKWSKVDLNTVYPPVYKADCIAMPHDIEKQQDFLPLLSTKKLKKLKRLDNLRRFRYRQQLQGEITGLQERVDESISIEKNIYGDQNELTSCENYAQIISILNCDDDQEKIAKLMEIAYIQEKYGRNIILLIFCLFLAMNKQIKSDKLRAYEYCEKAIAYATRAKMAILLLILKQKAMECMKSFQRRVKINMEISDHNYGTSPDTIFHKKIIDVENSLNLNQYNESVDLLRKCFQYVQKQQPNQKKQNLQKISKIEQELSAKLIVSNLVEIETIQKFMELIKKYDEKSGDYVQIFEEKIRRLSGWQSLETHTTKSSRPSTVDHDQY